MPRLQALHPCSADLAPTSGFLRGLCWFADPAKPADVRLLAAACRIVLAAPPGKQPLSALCQHAASSQEAASALLQQAQALTVLCLEALSAHAPILAPQLRQPRLGAVAAAAGGPGDPVTAPLVETLLLLTAQDTWKPAMGAAGAAEATARLFATAADAGLFGQLARIADAACPEPDPGAAPARQQQAAPAPVPSGEALATALTVRVLGQQAAVAARQRPRRLGPSRPRAGHAHQPLSCQVPLLLCLPLALRRLPTLRPVAGRLWRAAVATLHTLPPAELSAWLQAAAVPTLGEPAALAAAALLGNLLEGATAALQHHPKQPGSSERQHALQFAALACALLALLPQQAFFPASSGVAAGRAAYSWADEEEEEDGEHAAMQAASAAAASAAVSKLPWDAEQLPSADLVSQLQLVSNGALLRSLVRAVLPLAAPAERTAAAALPLQQRAADVRQLCRVLQRFMGVPGQRQRVLVMLAFSAELVQRLWYSYLQPAQAAPGEAPAGACWAAFMWWLVMRCCFCLRQQAWSLAEMTGLLRFFAALSCRRGLGGVCRQQLRPRLDAAPVPLQPRLQRLHHHRWGRRGPPTQRPKLQRRQMWRALSSIARMLPWTPRPLHPHLVAVLALTAPVPLTDCFRPAAGDELYDTQRPLPLDELRGERGGGVLALLKMALWHALWVEAAPSPGGWLPEAAALRAELKEAAGGWGAGTC